MVKLVIFMIKLTLLQTTYILQYFTYILTKHTQYFIKTHTNITIFNIFGLTVPRRDLRISLRSYLSHFFFYLFLIELGPTLFEVVHCYLMVTLKPFVFELLSLIDDEYTSKLCQLY